MGNIREPTNNYKDSSAELPLDRIWVSTTSRNESSDTFVARVSRMAIVYHAVQGFELLLRMVGTHKVFTDVGSFSSRLEESADKLRFVASDRRVFARSDFRLINFCVEQRHPRGGCSRRLGMGVPALVHPLLSLTFVHLPRPAAT